MFEGAHIFQTGCHYKLIIDKSKTYAKIKVKDNLHRNGLQIIQQDERFTTLTF